MANIRIIDLPSDAAPVASDVLAIDQATTRKATIADVCTAGVPIASTAEAEAGVDTVKRMTPATTAAAIVARGVGLFATQAQGDLADTAVQPTDLASYVQTTRLVSAGTGLDGGGDLSANRTLSLSSATQASLGLADSAIQAGDLGALAMLDAVTTAEITATGTPSASTFLSGAGTWAIPSGASVYQDYRSAYELVNSSETARGVGVVWRAGPYTYTELSPSFVGPCIEIASGVKLAPIPMESTGLKLEQFGVDFSNTSLDFSAEIQNAIDNGWDEDLGYIHPSIVGKVSRWSTLSQSASSLVITGDSLAFNGFGYPAGVAEGSDYATNNPNGLMSWAHLTRDVIIAANPEYLPYYEMDIATNATLTAPLVDGNIYRYGLNAQCVKAVFANQNQSLSGLYDGENTASLLIASSPLAEAVKFDIGSTTYDNLSDGKYLGYGYKLIPLPSKTFTVTNVRNYSNEAVKGGTLAIYGKTSASPMIARLTGKGAYTSGEILAEYYELVGSYSPDIVFYIIGANDIGTSVSTSTTVSNIKSFIDNVKTKTGSHVVLISAPPTSSYTNAVGLNLSFRMRKLAIDNGCSFIDLIHGLERIPVSSWRIDNIHFNTFGDTLVYKIIKDRIFQGVSDNNSFRPDRGDVFGLTGVRRKAKGFHIELSLPSYAIELTTDAAQSSKCIISGGAKMTLTPPTGYRVSSVSMDYAPTQPRYMAKIDSISSNTYVIGIYDVINNIPADTPAFTAGRLSVSFEKINTEF